MCIESLLQETFCVSNCAMRQSPFSLQSLRVTRGCAFSFTIYEFDDKVVWVAEGGKVSGRLFAKCQNGFMALLLAPILFASRTKEGHSSLSKLPLYPASYW